MAILKLLLIYDPKFLAKLYVFVTGPYTEGPRLTRILGLEKTVLHEIRVSGTVGGPLLTRKSLTYRCIIQKLR